MLTRYLKQSKFQKLYKLKYKEEKGKVLNYADTVVHKFDVATQKYIKFNVPKNALPKYYWEIDRQYIYDNDPKNIIDSMNCHAVYRFEYKKVFKYSLEHNAYLYEGKTSDYTGLGRKIMRDLVLYTADEE